MKTEEITFENKTYTLKALGFFSANRLLMDTLSPILTALMAVKGEKENVNDKTSLVPVLLTKLDADTQEKITRKLLEGVEEDGEKLDLECLDYELAIELLKGAVALNYSSLGKMLKRLQDKIPSEILQKYQQNMLPETEATSLEN